MSHSSSHPSLDYRGIYDPTLFRVLRKSYVANALSENKLEWFMQLLHGDQNAKISYHLQSQPNLESISQGVHPIMQVVLLS